MFRTGQQLLSRLPGACADLENMAKFAAGKASLPHCCGGIAENDAGVGRAARIVLLRNEREREFSANVSVEEHGLLPSSNVRLHFRRGTRRKVRGVVGSFFLFASANSFRTSSVHRGSP